LHCLNFGIEGDQTQNVLWRIENGELDFEIKPKIVVLLVGTFNYNHTADQIAEATVTIVKRIRVALPKTSIIVLSIPPRGREINVQREKIVRVNQLVERQLQPLICYDTANIVYLCCSKWFEFVNPYDGTISHNDMSDYLNFTNEGYQKFCEPIFEEINQLLSSHKN
jgi:platelet-activating factor acetylhydrolase IB subunit beta/gamma